MNTPPQQLPPHASPTIRRRASIASLIVIEIFVGIVLAAFAFIGFFDLSHRVLTEPFLQFDRNVMTPVYALRSPFMTQLMLFLTSLGSTGVLLPASGMYFIFLVVKKHRHEAILFAFTFVVGVLLNLLIKEIVARARPDVAPLIHEVFYSFPSGHSMNGFIFYALLAYFTYHFTGKLRLSLLVTLVCSLIILGIGISRIYLGVHYPSDVLAGFLAGFAWLLTVLVIDHTLKAYRTLPERKK